MKTWTTVSLYVDIDTGEQLTKEKAKADYEIIKKTKVSTLNKNKTHGRTEWLIQCRPKRQGKLWE